MKRSRVVVSAVWKHFDKIDKNRVKCRLCGKVYQSSGNTSNLQKHVREIHTVKKSNVPTETQATNAADLPLVPVPVVKRTLEDFFIESYPHDSSKKKLIDLKIALMIVRDFQPLSLVENEGFIDLLHELDPRYQIVSRKTLTYNILPRCLHNAMLNLRKVLEETSFICLTMDGWTSCSNQGYIGVTCHFINSMSMTMTSAALDTIPVLTDEKSETLKQIMQDLLVEWKIESKICCIVTDNAPNMIKAVELLKKRHLPCIAHTLNLTIKLSLKPFKDNHPKEEEVKILRCITNTISKSKNIITFFHSSTKAKRFLDQAKKDSESEVTGLVQQVSLSSRRKSKMFLIHRY